MFHLEIIFILERKKRGNDTDEDWDCCKWGGGCGKVEGQGFKGTMLHVQYNIIMSWR